MDEFDAFTQAAKAVNIQLARRGMKQADLAKKLGILPSTVSRALSSSPIDDRSSTWLAMLNELNLEIIIRPKRECDSLTSSTDEVDT